MPIADEASVHSYSDISAAVVEAVTWSEGKGELYAIDTYFREGYWSFADLIPLLAGTALCMLKPEAIVGRRLHSALSALQDSGFHPVDAIRVRFDRLAIREVYRYQFNRATPELLDAMDLVLPSTETVCLVLRDERHIPGQLPASVRLNSLKGPSDPALRRPEHFRHRLGLVNGLLNFMHVSDEPIDVIRETAVLCDADRRAMVGDRIRTSYDAVPEATAIFEHLYRSHPTHDLDPDASRRRLAADSGAAGRLARRMKRGEMVQPSEIVTVAREVAYADPMRWDLLTVLTDMLTVLTVPGITPVVPTITAAWSTSAELRALEPPMRLAF